MAAVADPRRRKNNKVSESLYAYTYIAPAIAAMVIASAVPIGFTLFVSVTNWDQYHPALVDGFHFIGLQNYATILKNLRGEILGVAVWTLAFAAISTVLNFGLGMVLAFLLNNPNMRERNIYRTLLIIPWALPGAIVTIAWQGLLNQDFGAVNNLIAHFGVSSIPWLTDPFWAKVAIIMVNCWLGYPFMMTACLGALQSIPTELNEAAEVDGAGIFTRFRKITFPLLRSATLPLVISTFAYNLNNFGAIWLLTRGGPTTPGSTGGSTDILATYTYRISLDLFLYAQAAAYSVFIFVFIGGLSLMNMKFSRAFEDVK